MEIHRSDPLRSSGGRVSIQEAMIALGVPRNDIIRRLHAEVFPWPARMLDNLRLFLGGDPFTPELTLVQDLADCSSGAEIAEAFFNYHSDPTRKHRPWSRLLRLGPRRSRVMKFYARLKVQRKRSEVAAPASDVISVGKS